MLSVLWVCAAAAVAVVVGSSGNSHSGVSAQPMPSPCVFFDQWQGFVQITTATSAVDQLNVTCPTDAGPLKSFSVTAVDPMVTTSLNFDPTASVGQLTVGVWANSPRMSWLNITWVDANDAVLVTSILVNVTYRGIPPTVLSAAPADPADTHVRTVYSGDVVSYAFVWTNANAEVLPSATHLTPASLTTTVCGHTTTNENSPWANLLTAESCSGTNGNAFPCTRNLTFSSAADDSAVGQYTYCLGERDDFYHPYCVTTNPNAPASAFPRVSTPTGGCLCVNFQVLSRNPTDPNHTTGCPAPPPDDGHGKGLSGGQIAAAVIIPVVGLGVLIGIAYWRQKTRAAVSDKGHVRMTDDASLNANL